MKKRQAFALLLLYICLFQSSYCQDENVKTNTEEPPSSLPISPLGTNMEPTTNVKTKKDDSKKSNQKIQENTEENTVVDDEEIDNVNGQEDFLGTETDQKDDPVVAEVIEENEEKEEQQSSLFDDLIQDDKDSEKVEPEKEVVVEVKKEENKQVIQENLKDFEGNNNWNYEKNGRDWTWNCKGNQQSPIDIEAIKGSCDNSMIFDFSLNDKVVTTMTVLEENRLLIKGQFSKLYATDVKGDLAGYNSKAIEIHSPSEHQIEGHLYDAEIQIIHEMRSEFYKDQKRTKAIVSIFVKVDDNSPANQFLTALNMENLSGNFDINIKKILGPILPTQIYFSYMGSRTIPPCTEDVNWYIIEKPMTMTSGQLGVFNNLWKNNKRFSKARNGNNRIIVPLNERLVKKGGIECEEQFVYFFSFFILYIFINYFIFKLL